MTHTNDHDFQQFRGAFDDAMIPDAAFKAKMEKLLQSEKPVEPERSSSVLASPSKKQTKTVALPRRSHPLMIAVAVLMVFSVVIASVWVLSGDVLEGEYASAPSGVATLPADVPLVPGSDVYLEANLVSGTQDAGHLHGIYEGIAIYQTHSSEVVEEGLVHVSEFEEMTEPYGQDRSLVAFDIQSGERLWERDDTSYESLHLYRDVLVGSQFRVSRFGEVRDRTLTGISLHTGEELWMTEVPNAADRTYNSAGFPVLVIDNLIVIPASDGLIRAWNIETGELFWESEFDPGTGQDLEWMRGEDDRVTVNMKTFAAMVWRDRIVLVNDINKIQILDPQDGETITSYLLSDSASDEIQVAEISYLQLLPAPSHILLIVSSPPSDGQHHAMVIAFDPLDEEIHWTQLFIGGIGSPSIAEDGTLVINSGTWHQNGWFLQLLGQSGYSTNQFYWFDGKTGEEILHTERTRDNRLYNFAVTNGEYACIRTEITEVVCLDRAGTRHIIDIELSGHMEFEKGMLYIPTEDGLMKVQLP